jgi:glycosyltransferase involved in cell wall biosynthesis
MILEENLPEDEIVGERHLKILMLHNSYQNPGGEDVVFRAEVNLLLAAGHQVCLYVRNNEEINQWGFIKKASLSLRTIWAWDSLHEVRGLLRNERPDIAHFHNTFPLISPSAYLACQEAGVPVVQYLHNPRLLCPSASLYRDGRVCEDCLGKGIPWPSVLHGCYRNSRVETGIVAAMLVVHRHFNTWKERVDAFVVFSNFYRRKFVGAGIPSEKVTVKPHFIAPDPGQTQSVQSYVLFVGRLAPEKGVLTLLDAWKELRSVPLKIRGEGPLMGCVTERARDSSFQTELVPRLNRERLVALFHGARFLLWPSEGYYESFGMVAAEAFACGLPVIASRIGVMEEIVRDGVTGLLFNPGDPKDLAAKVEWAWTHPEEMQAMGRHGRAEYELKYTGERNYEQVVALWDRLHVQTHS